MLTAYPRICNDSSGGSSSSSVSAKLAIERMGIFAKNEGLLTQAAASIAGSRGGFNHLSTIHSSKESQKGHVAP